MAKTDLNYVIPSQHFEIGKLSKAHSILSRVSWCWDLASTLSSPVSAHVKWRVLSNLSVALSSTHSLVAELQMHCNIILSCLVCCQLCGWSDWWMDAVPQGVIWRDCTGSPHWTACHTPVGHLWHRCHIVGGAAWLVYWHCLLVLGVTILLLSCMTGVWF